MQNSDLQSFNKQMYNPFPLISVVVPIYNVAPYLSKCIASICNQTYSHLEIMLVDDGSIDDSGCICDEWAKRDWRVSVIHQKNGGLVSARKAGMAQSSGEYILNVDGDDWIEEKMVETLLDRIVDDEGIDIVQCGFVTSDNKKYPCVNACYDLSVDKQRILENWMGNRGNLSSQIFTKIYKLDVFRNIYRKVPNDMSNGEDFIAFLYMLQYSKTVAVIQPVLYHYRIREDSLSHLTDDLELMKREDRLSCFMHEKILSLFPKILRENVDHWMLKRNIFLLRKTLISCNHHIPIYQYDNPAKLQNKEIVLYGAGSVGRDIYMQLSQYKAIEIVAWVDQKAESFHYDFRKVEAVERINKLDWDYLIVAILNESDAEEIAEKLHQDFCVSRSKIIWQYERLPVWMRK